MSDERFEKLITDMGYNYNEILALSNNPACEKAFEEKSQMYLAIIVLLEYMQSFGFSNDETLKIAKKIPQLFVLNIETLDSKLDYCSKRFEYTRETLIDLIKRFPYFLILTQDYVCQRVDDIMKLGYTQEQVNNITVQSPNLYALNIEHIREKDNFYRSIGLERVFMKFPESIKYSIELVYARYMFLKSIGIDINMDNGELLFENGFATKYGKSNSQLMEEYPYPGNLFKKRK